MSIGRLGAIIWPRWTIFCGEPLRISITLTIQRRLRPWNTKWKLPFMGLKPKQSKMYWKIGLNEWGTVRPVVAVIWMMLCFILEWKDSIFLIKPYFWKNIHKFFFYSRFKFQMLDSPPCRIYLHKKLLIVVALPSLRFCCVKTTCKQNLTSCIFYGSCYK